MESNRTYYCLRIYVYTFSKAKMRIQMQTKLQDRKESLLRTREKKTLHQTSIHFDFLTSMGLNSTTAKYTVEEINENLKNR